MTADLELLPLPEEEWNVRYGYCADTVTDYARANVAHATAPLQAEIEALRVEVAAQRTRADAMAGEAIKHEAQAERLAEALIAWHKQATDKGRREREESPGHSHAVLGVWDSDNGKYAGVECAQCALWFEATRLRAAQENDDA